MSIKIEQNQFMAPYSLSVNITYYSVQENRQEDDLLKCTHIN